MPREGLGEDPQLRQETGPSLHEEEAEQASGNVEGRDDPNGEVELVRDDAEQAPQHSTHHQTPHRDLLLPFGHMLRFLRSFQNQRLRSVRGRGLSTHDAKNRETKKERKKKVPFFFFFLPVFVFWVVWVGESE